MPSENPQPPYRIKPISCRDTLTFRTYLRRRDQESVAAVINYLEKQRISPFLFGSALDTSRYDDVDVLGVAKTRQDFDEIRGYLSLGTEMQIELGGRLFDVRTDEMYPTLPAEYKFIIIPVQNGFGRRFKRMAEIDLSLMTEANFQLLLEQQLAMHK